MAMKRMKRSQLALHGILVAILALTLMPFAFVVNNSFRTNSEMNHSFFGLPKAGIEGVGVSWKRIKGQDTFQVSADAEAKPQPVGYGEAMRRIGSRLSQGYAYAWDVLRPYTLNT